MKVTEIFYSVQGEGARAGEPSIFVRLAGCNLTCGFCDTEFESGVEWSPSKIAEGIEKILPDDARRQHHNHAVELWIVWTGGEPSLQLTAEIVAAFRMWGYKQAIETNGTNPLPPGLDWVCCSPKVAEHVLAKNFPNGVDELRYVRHKGQPTTPEPSITAKRYFLSPMFNGNRPDMENVKHCMKLCLENPKWSLSLQMHKLINVL